MVELGAGTGLLGIYVAVALHAAHVVVCDHFSAIDHLRVNVERNHKHLKTFTHEQKTQPNILVSPQDKGTPTPPLPTVSVLEHSWGDPLPHPSTLPRFDVVVASEVVYNGRMYAGLLKTIDELLLPEGHLLMSWEPRSHEEEWMDMLRGAGYRVLEMRHVAKHDKTKNTGVVLMHAQRGDASA